MGDPTLQELERNQAAEERQLQAKFALVPQKRYRSEGSRRGRFLRLLPAIVFAGIAASIIGLLISL